MGLLNYLGGRGSSAFGEGSSRHVESDVGGVTVGGVALEEEKSWEQPDPSVDNIPFTSFDEARASDSSRRRSSAAADRDHDNVVDALERDFDVTIPVEGRPLVPNSLHQIATLFILTTSKGIAGKPIRRWWQISLLVALLLLVLFQTACAYGIFLGLVRGSCIDSDDCSHGFWCDPTKSPPIGKKTRYFSICNRCDTSTLKNSEKVTDNQCLAFYLEDPSKATQLNTTVLALTAVQRAFCDGCYDIVDKGAASVSSYSASAPDGPDLDHAGFELYREIIVARVRSMQTLDWMVFLLNALVLCLSVANELFDIQYCRAIAESYPDAPLVKNICIWVVEAFRQYLFLPLTLAMPIGMVYTLGGSALQTTLNTLAVVFLLEIDDLLYNAVIDARYKRYARRHRFRLRWFDYYLLDAKRFVVIVTCMTAMVLLVNQHAPVWKSKFYGAFVLNRRAPDTLVDFHTGTRASSAAIRSCSLSGLWWR